MLLALEEVAVSVALLLVFRWLDRLLRRFIIHVDASAAHLPSPMSTSLYPLVALQSPLPDREYAWCQLNKYHLKNCKIENGKCICAGNRCVVCFVYIICLRKFAFSSFLLLGEVHLPPYAGMMSHGTCPWSDWFMGELWQRVHLFNVEWFWQRMEPPMAGWWFSQRF